MPAQSASGGQCGEENHTQTHTHTGFPPCLVRLWRTERFERHGLFVYADIDNKELTRMLFFVA
jgi:hypothetical protein